MITDKVIVSCEITDGYIFKKLIEILFNIVKSGNIIFTKDTWYLTELNPNNTMMIYVEIKTSELIDYVYNYDKDKLTIGVDFETIYRHSKLIAKKNSAIFRVQENGSPDNLLIVLSSENIPDSAVSPITVSMEDLAIPDYGTTPPILIKGDLFSKSCIAMTQLPNVLDVTITAYSRGFKMEPMESSAESFRTILFGQESTDEKDKLIMNPITKEYSSVLDKKNLAYITEEEEKAGVIAKFSIEKNKIKSLSKINSLFHMSTLKFWFLPSDPAKIQCRISSIGRFTMFIRNS